jgi:hypothetical protein
MLQKQKTAGCAMSRGWAIKQTFVRRTGKKELFRKLPGVAWDDPGPALGISPMAFALYRVSRGMPGSCIANNAVNNR